MLSLPRLLLLTVLTPGLAACSLFRPPPPPPHPPVVAEPVVVPPPDPPPIPLRKPPPPRSASTAAPAPTPPTEIAKLEPPSPPPPDAPSIVGLDQTTLQASFGSPDARRDAPPAEVWQYVDGDCTVDVYLFRDVQSGAKHALYVDVKGDDQSDQRRQSCLRRFAQRTAMGQRDPGAGSSPAR